MIRTKTNTALDHDVLIQSMQHDAFLQSIKHEASLWVYRHELRRIVLQELVRQTQAFSKPSMRRQLMNEIRDAAHDRIHSKIEKGGIEFVTIKDTNHFLLMKEIRARGICRASVKANHQRVMRELLQNVHRTKMMRVFKELTSSFTLEHNMKRCLLYELHRQHSFHTVSMRQNLMQQIRMAGRKRLQMRENHDRVMAELLFLRGTKQSNNPTGTYRCGPSMPKQLLVELLDYTSSRNLAKVRKEQMLLEVKRQQGFRHPSMRKKLMLEIHQHARDTSTKV